jgi:hypothetical protein
MVKRHTAIADFTNPLLPVEGSASGTGSRRGTYHVGRNVLLQNPPTITSIRVVAVDDSATKGTAEAELGEFGSTTNLADVVEAVATEFTGRTIRWTDDKRLAGYTVKTFAVYETRLWLHECDALKAAIAARGIPTSTSASIIEASMR